MLSSLWQVWGYFTRFKLENLQNPSTFDLWAKFKFLQRLYDLSPAFVLSSLWQVWGYFTRFKLENLQSPSTFDLWAKFKFLQRLKNYLNGSPFQLYLISLLNINGLTSFSRRFCNRSFNIIRLPLGLSPINIAAMGSETKLTVMHRTIRKPTQDISGNAVGDEVTE